MYEVNYKSTLRDWQAGFQMVLSHMSPFYWAVWCGYLISLSVGLALILWSKGYPSTWPPTQLPSRSMLSSMGVLIGIVLAAPISSSLIYGCFFRLRTVQLSPKNASVEYKIGRTRVFWKNVTEILNTEQYICFCQNFPSVILVPKSAFPSQEQSAAFFDQAKVYWHEAKGTTPPPVPDVSGVWPPAPSAGDSVEPGQGQPC